MFFCYLHTVGFWSIFTFILSFRKNKYQIHSYATSHMYDFETVWIYENLLVFAYFFLKKTGGFISFLWEIEHFQKYFHVPNTFETPLKYERYEHVCIFSLYTFLFAPVISTSIHRYVNYTDIQVLMMVTETETFNCRILPYPCRVEFSGEEVIVLPLASIASLFVYELRSR